MAMLCEYEQTDSFFWSSERTEFDSSTLTNHIRSMFESNGVDILNWAVFENAENPNVDKTVARNPKRPQIGFVSLNLNLEVELMIHIDTELMSCIESVRKAMCNCRNKVKNWALLRKLNSFLHLFWPKHLSPKNIGCFQGFERYTIFCESCWKWTEQRCDEYNIVVQVECDSFFVDALRNRFNYNLSMNSRYLIVALHWKQ